MKIENKHYYRIGLTLFALYLLIHYWGNIAGGFETIMQAAFPLILGGAIAYVLNILMSFYEVRLFAKCKKPRLCRLKRPICLILALFTLVMGAYILLRLVLPQLFSCFQVLLDALPDTLRSIYAWLDETFLLSARLEASNYTLPTTRDEWETMLSKGLDLLFNGFGGALNVVFTAVTSLASGGITFFLSMVFAFYILTGKERLANHFNRLSLRVLGPRITGTLAGVLEVLDSCFHSYVVGQCLEALILGGLCTLGMTVLRLPYALMIGALVGVTALIPIAGAYIGAVVGAVMIFSVSPVQALIFLIFLIILQQIEGNVIYPRTVGSSLALPGIWVLAAVTIGGGVLGIIGMVLFVPLTAALYRMLKKSVLKGEKQSLPPLIETFKNKNL